METDLKSMRKTVLMIVVMLLNWSGVSGRNWKPEEVKAIIAKVNNSWQKQHPANRDRAFWDPAVYHTGNMEAYFLFCESNDEKERETADRWRKTGGNKIRIFGFLLPAGSHQRCNGDWKW